MTDEYDTLRDWLRMKWIPGDPTADDIMRLNDFLGMSQADRSETLRTMSDVDVEYWIEVETARALYVDPIDRGGITEAKVARYPERYGSGFKTL